MGNIMFGLNPKCVKRSVKGGGGSVMVWGNVFFSRHWAYTATWQGECKYLSEPPLSTCGSFTASISQSVRNFHARKSPLSHCKMGKAVPWSWEHWHNEMASPESWSKPEQCENLVMSCGRRCAEVIQIKGLHFLLIFDCSFCAALVTVL